MKKNETLEKLRNQIDQIDEEILKILSKRINIVKKIGEFKKENKIDFFDSVRYKNLLDEKIKKAKIFGIDEEFIHKIYNLIHNHSIKIQKENNL